MSRPANKELIGAFILGGLALAVAMIALLGGGRVFSHRTKFEVYFTGSVKGLQVGSPVMFKGVPIGQVRDIDLRFNAEDLSYTMPVEIEIDPGKIQGLRTGVPYQYIGPLIAKGLRAQLQVTSLLTGQLIVGLDFYPDKPAILRGAKDADYPEIPTVPSDFEQLGQGLSSSLAGLSRLLNSPATADLTARLGETLAQLQRLLKSLDSLSDYLARHPEAILRGKAPSKGEKK